MARRAMRWNAHHCPPLLSDDDAVRVQEGRHPDVGVDDYRRRRDRRASRAARLISVSIWLGGNVDRRAWTRRSSALNAWAHAAFGRTAMWTCSRFLSGSAFSGLRTPSSQTAGITCTRADAVEAIGIPFQWNHAAGPVPLSRLSPRTEPSAHPSRRDRNRARIVYGGKIRPLAEWGIVRRCRYSGGTRPFLRCRFADPL